MNSDLIFVIEDDDDLVDVFSHALRARGFSVAVQDSIFGAAARIRKLRPQVILLDIGLPYRPGTALLAEPDHTYIYGVEHSGGTKYLRVARAPKGDVGGAWEFFTGTDWSPSAAWAAGMITCDRADWP